ncbi:hypothetical protein ABW19_dt0210372 [Dactylella cylindrospora]|nr:hypothetical protein ABW19_dt0210372 [Dactylella cylindrospora]
MAATAFAAAAGAMASARAKRHTGQMIIEIIPADPPLPNGGDRSTTQPNPDDSHPTAKEDSETSSSPRNGLGFKRRRSSIKKAKSAKDQSLLRKKVSFESGYTTLGESDTVVDENFENSGTTKKKSGCRLFANISEKLKRMFENWKEKLRGFGEMKDNKKIRKGSMKIFRPNNA